jgi:hypothetical protein
MGAKVIFVGTIIGSNNPFAREAVSLMAEYTPVPQHDLSNDQNSDENEKSKVFFVVICHRRILFNKYLLIYGEGHVGSFSA